MGATPFPGLLHFTFDPYLIMLIVKQGSTKYRFWVFGMTRPGIEPRSLGPLANTLLIRPMARYETNNWFMVRQFKCLLSFAAFGRESSDNYYQRLPVVVTHLTTEQAYCSLTSVIWSINTLVNLIDNSSLTTLRRCNRSIYSASPSLAQVQERGTHAEGKLVECSAIISC